VRSAERALALGCPGTLHPPVAALGELVVVGDDDERRRHLLSVRIDARPEITLISLARA